MISYPANCRVVDFADITIKEKTWVDFMIVTVGVTKNTNKQMMVTKDIFHVREHDFMWCPIQRTV